MNNLPCFFGRITSELPGFFFFGGGKAGKAAEKNSAGDFVPFARRFFSTKKPSFDPTLNDEEVFAISGCCKGVASCTSLSLSLCYT